MRATSVSGLANTLPTTANLPPTLWHVYLPTLAHAGVARSDGRASWSAPLAVSPFDGMIWVVNPDAGSVTALAADTLAPVAEIPAGLELWSLVVAPDGRRVLVVDRAQGMLIVIDADQRMIEGTVPVGPEPIGVALSPSGATAYVTVSSAGEVVVVDIARLQVRARVGVSPQPWAVAVSDDGDADDDDEQVYVTHLFAFTRSDAPSVADQGRDGRVTMIAAMTNAVTREIALPPDSHGFPNLLAGISLFGQRAWAPHIRAAPELPNSLSTTVFAAVSTLDLQAGNEQVTARLNLNDEEVFGSPVNNPVAAVPSWDGQRLYVVLAGSDLVEVVDVGDVERPRLVKFLPAGKNPRGMALSADGRWGYVMSYLSRAITVLDLARLEVVATIPVTGETLDPQLLRGKILFHTAAQPQMAGSGWMSCASCHVDGGTDSVTWMFPDGPRQSPPLWNSGRTLPWHWSAALDELQDVEDTIHTIQRGVGLAPGSDPPLLGAPNAGRSAALDALGAFLERGIRAPTVLLPTMDVAPGRRLFRERGCIGCHAGPEWTISTRPGTPGTLDADGNGMVDAVLRDVGSLSPADLRGASGFDVPSLLGVGLTAPYLHDGSLPTIDAVLASGHPRPQQQNQVLSKEEIAALVEFLNGIGPTTVPLERP